MFRSINYLIMLGVINVKKKKRVLTREEIKELYKKLGKKKKKRSRGKPLLFVSNKIEY